MGLIWGGQALFGGSLGLEKILEVDICANTIFGTFLCFRDSLKLKVYTSYVAVKFRSPVKP